MSKQNMKSISTQTHLRKNKWARPIVLAGGALAAVGTAFWVQSQSGPVNIPEVALSSTPLYAAKAGDKPAMALALSVEYPTVGAQYLSGVHNAREDDTYSNKNEYIGYYDAESCYLYVDAPTENLAGLTQSDYKRFQRSGPATDRMCDNAFSGNFLNWASASAIDMLRLALSGGDRYIDQKGLTVLQRAVLPENKGSFWNGPNFPAKRLTRQGAGATQPYWGAVPRSMRQAADKTNSDIFVANILNRIYFGTSIAAKDKKESYSLGTIAVASNSNNSVIASYPVCSNENGVCRLPNNNDKYMVYYGAVRGSEAKFIGRPVKGSIDCNNATFGDAFNGVVKKCHYVPYNAAVRAVPQNGDTNTDGFFYSRVQVCDKDKSGNLADQRDYNFCTRYPDGNFKPTGVIQKYSNQLRLAAFGYAIEDTASYHGGRFGGVLRAPMKYVGDQVYDAVGNLIPGGNARREWDPVTGIFVQNPENDTVFGVSGVVNYLNKFGRTGKLGNYKTYDPVGELYHETLTYMQGREPSPDAKKDLDLSIANQKAFYDGFPIYTNWANYDPYPSRTDASSTIGYSSTDDYSCLKSNIVLIGDVNSHDGNVQRLPGYRSGMTASEFYDKDNNIPNYHYWSNVVHKFETGGAGSYTDGQGDIRQISNPNANKINLHALTESSYGGSNYEMAGMAYWAHSHDIRGKSWKNNESKQRPGLRVKTFVFDVNEYAAGSNPVNRHANKFFLAAKYGGYNHVSEVKSNKPFNTYGNPFVDSVTGQNNNDVWQKPLEQGEAGTYYLQSNARGVLASFENIFKEASTKAFSVAGLASQASVLTDKGAMVYQASFDTAAWTGDLQAFALTAAKGDAPPVLSSSATWSAQEKLSQMGNPAATRKIVLGGGGGSKVASDFSWNALSSTMQKYLNAEDNEGAARVQWLRGDQREDGGKFRSRSGNLLGDILNSGAVYSGAPSLRFGTADYAQFAKKHADRAGIVTVGANDGMLHAFDAETGEEKFAYIPGWLAPKLSLLTHKDYAGSHQSYVDATPVVSDAVVNNDWKTVLVGGTGGGGRGVYALDITEPDNFGPDKALWEFTANDDADMGFVIGSPRLVLLRTSAKNANSATDKWFVAVASGVNNYAKDSYSEQVSSTGRPAIFLLDLSKGKNTPWKLGENFYKISLPVDAGFSRSHATGVINLNVAWGNDKIVHKLFAGDLHGNMWAFDFRKPEKGAVDWNFSNLSSFGNDPMFVAKDDAGTRQPITVAPVVASGTEYESLIVAFGTGKYLEAADRINRQVNTFYALYDDGSARLIGGRGYLQAGIVDKQLGKIVIPSFRWGKPSAENDPNRRAGWYFDFASSGERQVLPAAGISVSTVNFGTVIPDESATAAHSCGGSIDSGALYSVDLNGNGVFVRSNVGLYGGAVMLQTNVVESRSDSTGRRRTTVTEYPVHFGSEGAMVGSKQTYSFVSGRLSWRQIQNYLDQKNDIGKKTNSSSAGSGGTP